MRKTKQIKLSTMLLVALLTLSLSISVFASSNLGVFINQNKVEFATAPILEDGVTFVGLRGVFEELGATVSWEKKTQTATIETEDKSISISVDKADAVIKTKDETKTVKMPMAAKLVNGSMMIPLRFVSEELNAEVKWDEKTGNVYISTTGQEIVIPETPTEPTEPTDNKVDTTFQGLIDHAIKDKKNVSVTMSNSLSIDDQYSSAGFDLVGSFNESDYVYEGTGSVSAFEDFALEIPFGVKKENGKKYSLDPETKKWVEDSSAEVPFDFDAFYKEIPTLTAGKEIFKSESESTITHKFLIEDSAYIGKVLEMYNLGVGDKDTSSFTKKTGSINVIYMKENGNITVQLGALSQSEDKPENLVNVTVIATYY